MSKLQSRSALLKLFSVCILLLSACSGGGGGTPWVYKPQASAPAEQPPNQLADPYENQPAQSQNAANESLLQGGYRYPAKNAPQDASEVQNQAAALEAQRPELPPVKVALLLPLSGQHSALGQAMLNASQIALFDVGHAKFNLIPRDTKGTSDGAAQAAQMAINDGAQLILGPVFADSVRAVKGVARRRGVNVVAFSTDWSLADGNTYLMGFLPFGQIERVVSYAAGQGIHNVGVLAPDTVYGNASVQAYNSAALRAGITTIDSKNFKPGARNSGDTVKRFARYDERITTVDGQEQMAPPPFDAIFLPAGGSDLRTIANAASQYGLIPREVRRLGTGLWDDPALRGERSLNGGWFAAPSPKLRREFETRYKEFYSESAPRLATLAYDATALAAILAQTGLQTSGRPAFDRSSITNPNGFAGIDGIFRFRSDGLVERGLAILELRGGRVVIVDDAPNTFQNYGSF